MRGRLAPPTSSGELAMITQSKPEFARTPRSLCRVFFRHKAKIIFCFVLSICASAAVVLFWPRSYQSQAKLFVHVGRETVTLDPTATTGQVIPVAVSRETEVGSVLEMLRSRIMVEKLVDEIGPDVFLRSAAKQDSGSGESGLGISQLLSLAALDPVSKREK